MFKVFYVFVSGNIFISRKSTVSVEEFEDEEDGPSTNVVYKIGMHILTTPFHVQFC